jgi:hypothetical protein
VPVRLRLSGGATRIALDASRLGAAARETLLESDGFAASAPGWDIEVSGGASALTIDT